MKVTVVGCGSAFADGQRFQTCFRVDAAGRTVLVDFGATALMGWKALGSSTDDIDAVVLSHLHGDHFGGLPFLILEAAFVARRTKPLRIVGPPGAKGRVRALCEASYPGMTDAERPFAWSVEELEPGASQEVAGFSVSSTLVSHPSGAPSTALRLSAEDRAFAYSGDTIWTDALVAVAEDADLFVIECTSGDGPMTGHIDWQTLEARAPELKAKRVAVTHLGGAALARAEAMRRAGFIVLADGMTFDL